MVSKLKFYIDDMLSRGSNSLILWLGIISLMAVIAAAGLVWICELGPQESFGGLFWDLLMWAVTPWEIDASMVAILGISVVALPAVIIAINLSKQPGDLKSNYNSKRIGSCP